MYALPRALERYKGLSIAGQVAYPEHVVDIPADAVSGRFVENLGRPHSAPGVAEAGKAGAQSGGVPVL